MAEQTEKAFMQQPKMFLCSKKSGKGGYRFWKSIGLGFKTPKEAINEQHGTFERNSEDEDTHKAIILDSINLRHLLQKDEEKN